MKNFTRVPCPLSISFVPWYSIDLGASAALIGENINALIKINNGSSIFDLSVMSYSKISFKVQYIVL
tara:strand:- start:450 stop:650 length:201 start_codon:yes stop_codon:yes gene_type:complete